MGLLKWLQKKGTTGSIARWAFKYYEMTMSLNPHLTEVDSKYKTSKYPLIKKLAHI